MSATKPIELQNAITAADEAWGNYDSLIEAGASKEERQQAWDVVNWLEERKGQMYTAWQNAGGTSDIDCVTFPNRIGAESVDVTRYFGGIKATATREWMARHL